jgi:hypothetical protein
VRGRLRAAVAVARCQGGAALLAGAAVVIVAGRLLPIEPVRVVGRPDVRTVVWPLVPALAALAVPIGAMARFATWTWVTGRPAWQARAAFVGPVVAAAALVVVAAPVDRTVVARNLALFDGLALLAVALLGRPPWGLLVGLPVVVWFVGVDPPDAVRWWAVPLLPPGHVGAAAVAVAFALVGIAAHVLVPPRCSVAREGAPGPASRWRPPWRRPPRPGRSRRVGAGSP